MTDHSSANALSQGAAIQSAMFLNAWIYGDGTLPAAFGGADPADNGYDDDYAGFIAAASGGTWTLLDGDALGDAYFDAAHGVTEGGLYIGDLPNDPGSGAEALVATTEIEGQTTLVIAFRGTDDDGAALGPPFLAPASLEFYLQLRPVVLAARDYAADPANGIDAVIVSGHSLGGAMADVFSLLDAGLFTDAGVPLTVVSLASSGVPPGVVQIAGFLNGAPVGDVDAPTEPQLFEPVGFTHLGVAQSVDPVRFPEAQPLPVVRPLIDNAHYDTDLLITLPNVDFDAADGSFGAGHSIFLYWPNIDALVQDVWYAEYGTQTVIMGASTYDSQPTLTDISVDSGYVPQFDGYSPDDRGLAALRGTDGADYILGLDGSDLMLGRGGGDLMSGGAGRDILLGGDGGDRLDGGAGEDILLGGAGADILRSDGDGDRMIGGAGADIFEFAALGTGATISDFEDGTDLIDLRAPGLTEDDITIAAQSGGVAVTAGAATIFLTGVAIGQIDAADFLFAPEADFLI